jgi:predicted nucleic acid-binding protein
VLLIDNSAWARRRKPGARGRIEAAFEAGDIVVCLPFLLEAGYSARSGGEHDAQIGRLRILPRVEVTSDVERLALRAQSELAAVGHHRVAPADLLLAACAHHAGHAVLHYDHDYDVIATRTSLEFESQWVAPAGTLD